MYVCVHAQACEVWGGGACVCTHVHGCVGFAGEVVLL